MPGTTRRAPRSSVLDDETPLDGARVDVAVRCGWVLRMARLTSGEAPVGMEEMARRTGVATTRLHRVETGQLRAGRVVDVCEAALGLVPGSVRAPVDVICRGFAYAPTDRDPRVPVTSVAQMSALTDAVDDPGRTGGDWLAWARALGQPGAIGLPLREATRLARALVSELQRAVSHAHPSRYEAAAALRCGPYARVVLDVARETAEDPRTQVLYDVMSVVGEAADADTVAWCLRLLEHERPRLVVAGALALENMGEVVGDPALWAGLVDPLLDLLAAYDEETVQHTWVSHLLRLVPPPVMAASRRRPARPLAPVADIPDTSRTRRNRHWSQCQDRAREVTSALGLPEQPVLARLLYEVAMGPHETRAVTGYMLLGALPRLRRPLAEHVAELAERHPDPVVRDRAGRRLAGMLHGETCEVAERWLVSGDDDERDRALLLAGAAGRVVPEAVLRERVAAGSVQAPLYAAGMAGHPALPALAADPALPEAAREAAAWWLEGGSRVTV